MTQTFFDARSRRVNRSMTLLGLFWWCLASAGCSSPTAPAPPAATRAAPSGPWELATDEGTTRWLLFTPTAGTSFAGRNNPDDATGEEDNIALVVGAVVSTRRFSLRPEVHWGEHSVQWTPSLTYDFPVAGEGPGSIRGNVGLGYSFLDQRENNVLGNTASPFFRLGAEGQLVHEVIVSAALMVAPRGYERRHTAIAGSTQVGIRF